ncbi:MAG: hypothetical protein AAF289_02795, partial [Cyanobacteria bacterium P01_A01_bin.135]
TARASGSNQNHGTTLRDFPFPLNFDADEIIAVQDTNGNGIIDSFPGNPAIPFPFQDNPINLNFGSAGDVVWV